MENKRRNEIMNGIIRFIKESGTKKYDGDNYSKNLYFREIGDVTYVYADEKCTKEVRNTYYELPELYYGNLFFDTPRFEKVSRIELSFNNGSPSISLYIPSRELPVCRVLYKKEESKDLWHDLPTYTYRGISDDKIAMLANVLLDDDAAKPAAKAEDRIYYIENSVNEYDSVIQGYFPTLDAAKVALKDCADWCRPKGTGKVYSTGFGLDVEPVLEYEIR